MQKIIVRKASKEDSKDVFELVKGLSEYENLDIDTDEKTLARPSKGDILRPSYVTLTMPLVEWSRSSMTTPRSGGTGACTWRTCL